MGDKGLIWKANLNSRDAVGDATSTQMDVAVAGRRIIESTDKSWS